MEMGKPRWINALEPNLQDDMALEWSSYTSSLVVAGISLHPTPGKVILECNRFNDDVTTKQIYHHIVALHASSSMVGILSRLWDGRLPLKMICFAWLCYHRKILTWNSLQKWGIIRPGRCHLCSTNHETVDHIFGGCAFFQTFWNFMCIHLLISARWDRPYLTDSIGHIIKNSLLSMDIIIVSL